MICTFLGTGTSNGIPVIGCNCKVCLSQEIKNTRTRTSLLIKNEFTTTVIDTTPEFRIQAIRENINKLDSILFTHSHADHLHGLDDIRPLSFDKKIDVYSNRATISDIKKRFDYIFKYTQKGGGKPRIKLIKVHNKHFYLGNNSLKITPIPIFHGKLKILGYRINDLAYITDCSELPDKSKNLIKGAKVLVLGALRFRKHSTHMNIDQAIELSNIIKPKKTYLVHFSHDIDHD